MKDICRPFAEVDWIGRCARGLALFLYLLLGACRSAPEERVVLEATFGRVDMLNYVNADIAGREFRWKNSGSGPPDRVVDYVEERNRTVLATSGRLPCWAVHLPFAWQYHSEELIAGIRMFAASGCVAGPGQSCLVVVDDGADRRFADLEEIRDIYWPAAAGGVV